MKTEGFIILGSLSLGIGMGLTVGFFPVLMLAGIFLLAFGFYKYIEEHADRDLHD